MLRSLLEALVLVPLEAVRQLRPAMLTAEALIWHHGYKGLERALRDCELATGRREVVRATLVAEIAADRYVCLKHADAAQRAAFVDHWSRRNGQMIRFDQA